MNSLHNDILHSLISQAVLESPLVIESELNKNEVLNDSCNTERLLLTKKNPHIAYNMLSLDPRCQKSLKSILFMTV